MAEGEFNARNFYFIWNLCQLVEPKSYLQELCRGSLKMQKGAEMIVVKVFVLVLSSIHSQICVICLSTGPFVRGYI